jgi:transcriptional regulator with AAA-type ATPase domain
MTSAFNQEEVIQKLCEEVSEVLKNSKVPSDTSNSFETAAKGQIELSYTVNDKDTNIVYTKEIQRRVDYILPWVQNGQPFLIAGPEGCGKETIVRAAFNQIQDQNIKIVRIYCSS